MKNFIFGFAAGMMALAVLTYPPASDLSAKAPQIPQDFEQFIDDEYRQVYAVLEETT